MREKESGRERKRGREREVYLPCDMEFVEGVTSLMRRTNHINAEACRIPKTEY